MALAGIPVFPCAVDGKLPATAHGFKDATTDIAQIDAWWSVADYNVAVEPEQVGWCVIDLDGAEGQATWSALVKANGAPRTYTVTTPSGGRHRYFEGSTASSVRKLGAGVDTRGRGGYVLLPPSVVNGKPYVVSDDSEIAPLPDWITATLEKPAATAAPAPAEVDQATAEARSRVLLETYVREGRVSVEGAGGDDHLIKLCFLLHDLGLAEDKQLALLEEIWNPHCNPPWSADELSVKIGNASRYAQNTAGVSASAPAVETFHTFLESQGAASVPARSALPDPIRLGDIPGDEEPVAMVVAQWVQKNKINILRGRGGSNKSRLALEWSMMIDAGVSVAGFTIPERATALYLSCEDDKAEVKRRRNALMRKLGLGASGVLFFDMTDEEDAFLLFVSDEAGVVKTAKWADLEARLMAIEGHKFVVLDSTYDVIDFAGATKNSDNHVRTVIRMLDKLCRQTDSTIVCLWHPSRAGMGRGDEGGFSTAWDNAPRNAISIKPVEGEENTFSLQAEKRNNLAPGSPLFLRWTEGALLPITDNDATTIMEHEIIVAVALKAAHNVQPIQRRQKPMDWILSEIKEKAGRTVSVRQIKDHLETETRRDDGRLEYRLGDRHGRGDPAGFVQKSLAPTDE